MLSKLNKILLFLVLMLFLNGCLGDQSWCITTDPDAYLYTGSIKNTTNKPFNVNANGVDPSNASLTPGGWVYTGVGVAQGDNITISASGSMLLTVPYGLASGSTGSMNQSYLLAAVNQSDTSSYFDNGGLGTQMVIMASSANPTLIADPVTKAGYVFVPGQNVYVTTKDCATGDTYSTTPSKWTWSKWNTTAVRCSTRGTRNFTVNEPYCKAVKCCKSDSVTCFDTNQWQCSYVIISSSNNMVDMCSTAKNNYNCEANAEESGTCYNTSGYNRSSGWCGGSHKFRNITVSDDQPSCSLSNSSTNVTTPVINSCGTGDTCWNLSGYKMYAFNANASCPTDVSCVHLNKSGYTAGGKMFQAQGGEMYLKIIDPDAPASGATVDVSGMQSQVTANDQTIAGLVLTNNALNDSLYQVTGQMISDGTTATSDGLLTKINKYNSGSSSYTPASTLQSQADSYSSGSGSNVSTMTSISAKFSSLLDNFSSLTAFISAGSTADDADDVWTTISAMSSDVSALQSLVNSLDSSSVLAGQSPTSAQVSSYKTSASSMLSALAADIASAQSTQNSITANEAQIDTLSTANDSLNSQIIAASNGGPNGAVGGYTTYVRSDPIIAQNGQYLQVIISSQNPNYSNVTTTDLGTISSSPKNVSISQTGDLWARIVDADGSYSENIGSYSVNVGEVTSGSGFGNIFTSIINQIITKIESLTQSMYQHMTCTVEGGSTDSCTDYIQLVRLMLLLYVMIYGFMYITGLVRDSAYDLLLRLIKIGLVASLLSTNSFDFFNDTVFKGFLSLTNTLISSASGAPLDNPFAFLEQSMAILILDPNTYLKIISLMFIGLLGFVAFILMIYGIFKYLSAVFHAMTTYVMAYVGMAMCFILAPIFIPFALFRRTVHLFENWYTMLFRFAIEPALLLVGLILFNAMLLNILQELFNFSACFKCLIPISFAIPGVPSVPSTTLFCIPGFAPWGVDNLGSGMAFGVFFSIPLAISFCIITRVMDIYSKKFAKQISSQIFGEGLSMLNDKQVAALEFNPFKDISDAYTKAKNMAGGGAKREGGNQNQATSDDSTSPGGSPGNQTNSGLPQGQSAQGQQNALAQQSGVGGKTNAPATVKRGAAGSSTSKAASGKEKNVPAGGGIKPKGGTIKRK